MSQPVRLYQGTLSSSSWRLRIALALKGIAYDSVQVDIAKEEQYKPAFGEVAPLHQVPCIEIDGHVLYQSVAILEYLDETRPDPRLIPQDAYARAQVRAIVEVINSVIQPLHNTPVRKRLVEQFGVTMDDANAWCRYWIEHRFDDLERIIAASRGRYAFGDTVTMADVFLYPQIGTCWRFGVDMSKYPVLQEITTALAHLPAFSESHPTVA
ncbi:MAG: maleylacetoacetate isomerase [Burkholderiales bacterium]|nr:maleylacetoacetate isomerase [Burkholderiales bacterium]